MSASGKEKLQETREKLQRKAEQTLSDIRGLEPILKESGFAISEIEVTLSVPPGFTAFVQHTGEEKKSLERTLAEEADTLTRLQKAFLRSLLRANELAQISDKYGYRFREYELAIGLPPGVTVHLVPKEPTQDTDSAV
jgi:hypothetical protein